jgi:hypothetical protein
MQKKQGFCSRITHSEYSQVLNCKMQKATLVPHQRGLAYCLQRAQQLHNLSVLAAQLNSVLNLHASRAPRSASGNSCEI